MQRDVANHSEVESSQPATFVPPPKRRKLVRAGILALIVVIVAAFIWVGRRGSEKQAQNAQGSRGAAAVQRATPVGVAPVQRRDVPVYLSGLGSVQAFNTVTVRTRVDGQLVKVNFREGQEVHKGELLAVIDPRPFEVALSQAEAMLFRDQ